MGLELDSLKVNDGVCVIYDNTTGQTEEFYDIEGVLKFIEKHKTKSINEYFSWDELEEFFIEHNLEMHTYLINKYYGRDEE